MRADPNGAEEMKTLYGALGGFYLAMVFVAIEKNRAGTAALAMLGWILAIWLSAIWDRPE